MLKLYCVYNEHQNNLISSSLLYQAINQNDKEYFS